MSVPANALFLLLSFSSLGAGLVLAFVHPLAPMLVTLVFLGLYALLLWQSRIGLFLLPIFLPLLNFSPWTGWLIVDEFDLLVLAVVAAGYFRMHRDAFRLEHSGVFIILLTLVVLLVVRGASDVITQNSNGFSDYLTPLNSLRVGKSLLWVVLVLPLVAQAGQTCSPRTASAYFFGACLLGSFWVVLAVFWERAFYPGLLDISTPYRTVALFWEMHLGGAALDAYLVLIAPLLVWAWRTTTSFWAKQLLGVFVLAFVYVCLTTFSRGVIAAIAGSMLLLSALLVWRREKGKYATSGFSLNDTVIVLLVALEVMLVFGSDSFMSRRLAASERDFGGRLQHWRQGVGLLKTSEDWLFGIGLGQLPSRQTQGDTGLTLPGAVYRNEVATQRSMIITGPNGSINAQELGGLYALTQRVDLFSGQRYLFSMDARSDQIVEFMVQVCALHLLYPATCQESQFRISPGSWQNRESVLSGNSFGEQAWLRGHGVLMLSVLTPGAKIEIANLHLSAGGGSLLRNAQFQDAGSSWFPAARFYFLPWHIDNLYLEILIETGLVGLFFFLIAVLLIVWRLFVAYLRGSLLAPYFLSCIASLMALGMVVSVLDMPRVATLLGIFLACAWQWFKPALNRRT